VKTRSFTCRRVPALIALALGLVSCTNEVTPEGYQGYVFHVPMIFGGADYIGTQNGPTSTGVTWRQYVINVDIRPKNYTEDFQVLSKDNLLVGFQAHARIGIRPNSIKQLVEEMGSGDITEKDGPPEWFKRAVKQAYRSAVRDVVYTYDAYDIQAKTQDISVKIAQRLRDEFAETPVEFEAISIGNLTYPEAINAEIQQKLAAEQDLERMARERQIAEQESQIKVTEAKGRAAAQRIVNETLTPLYVQHEMLEGFRALSKSPRVTIVSTPHGDGGSPVIVSVPATP
jgi:regulator of protease activity HflC (stomatin/prohibitin superfamily)